MALRVIGELRGRVSHSKCGEEGAVKIGKLYVVGVGCEWTQVGRR